MKIRKRSFKRDQSEQNFWPSFTDLISTIALILFFLILLAYIQNIITGSNLEVAQRRLERARAEISQAEKDLMLLEDEVEQTMAELEDAEIALKLSEEEIEEQKEIIARSNEELGVMRGKLQDIAFLRLDILERVKESVERELGSTGRDGEEIVTIGETANIIIRESVVFDFDSFQIRSEGREILRQLAIAFENVLDDRNVRENIDSIVIEGHTDSRGDPDYNRLLSVRRANAVVNYLMESNPQLQNKYGRYFAATGYSEFRPLVQERTEEDRRRNRRIEISIVVKDDNIENLIEKYLEDTEELFELDDLE